MVAIFLQCHPQDRKLDYPFVVFQVRINLKILQIIIVSPLPE